jgi:hypothetical protein
MTIIFDRDTDRHQLIKTAENEAVDLHTGEKYKLERVNDPAFLGWGIFLGLASAFLFLTMFYTSSAPSQPNPLPPIQYPVGETSRL